MSATRTIKSYASHPDLLLLGFVSMLVVIGLQAVFSATFALAITEYNDMLYFLLRQAVGAAIGMALLLLLMRMDYHVLKPLSPFIVAGALVLLLAVLVPGLSQEQYGAARWLRLGPLPPLQPSEFAKLALVIGMAAWLSDPRLRPQRPLHGIPPFVSLLAMFGAGLGVFVILIMKEPDLGTTLVMILTALTMFYVSGADFRALLLLLACGAALTPFLVGGASYRHERLDSFLHPWDDPSGVGFHIIQLLIALGSGGLFGLGIGASRQKFFYVPSAHTDGIFAILGEEVGFIGCVVVLLLYAGLVYRAARIAQRAPDSFGQLLAVGTMCWIAYQTLINLGGITWSIPLTGIPLPFLSYGGSSIAATLGAIGILLSVSRQSRPPAPAAAPRKESR